MQNNTFIKVLIAVSPLCLYFCVSRAQVPFFGKCPHYPTVKNFSIKKLEGRWYEVEKFFQIKNFLGSCTITDFKMEGNDSFRMSHGSFHRRTGSMKEDKGIATLVNPMKKDGKFRIKHHDKLLCKDDDFDEHCLSSYWILATDYRNYTIAWSCRNAGLINLQSLWFLSRRRNPCKRHRMIVYNLLRKLRIPTRILTHTSQKACVRFQGLLHNGSYPDTFLTHHEHDDDDDYCGHDGHSVHLPTFQHGHHQHVINHFEHHIEQGVHDVKHHVHQGFEHFVNRTHQKIQNVHDQVKEHMNETLAEHLGHVVHHHHHHHYLNGHELLPNSTSNLLHGLNLTSIQSPIPVRETGQDKNATVISMLAGKKR